MDIKSFEEYLRQSNMAENTISAYLYAIKEFYSRHVSFQNWRID